MQRVFKPVIQAFYIVPYLPFVQSTSSCSDRSVVLPRFLTIIASSEPRAENAQHEPQEPCNNTIVDLKVRHTDHKYIFIEPKKHMYINNEGRKNMVRQHKMIEDFTYNTITTIWLIVVTTSYTFATYSKEIFLVYSWNDNSEIKT